MLLSDGLDMPQIASKKQMRTQVKQKEKDSYKIEIG